MLGLLKVRYVCVHVRKVPVQPILVATRLALLHGCLANVVAFTRILLLQQFDLLMLEFALQLVNLFLHSQLLLHHRNVGVRTCTESLQYCFKIGLQNHFRPAQLRFVGDEFFPGGEVQAAFTVCFLLEEECLLGSFAGDLGVNKLLVPEVIDVHDRNATPARNGNKRVRVDIEVREWRHLLGGMLAVDDAPLLAIAEQDELSVIR